MSSSSDSISNQQGSELQAVFELEQCSVARRPCAVRDAAVVELRWCCVALATGLGVAVTGRAAPQPARAFVAARVVQSTSVAACAAGRRECDRDLLVADGPLFDLVARVADDFGTGLGYVFRRSARAGQLLALEATKRADTQARALEQGRVRNLRLGGTRGGIGVATVAIVPPSVSPPPIVTGLFGSRLDQHSTKEDVFAAVEEVYGLPFLDLDATVSPHIGMPGFAAGRYRVDVRLERPGDPLELTIDG